jgi:hypothetical protein
MKITEITDQSRKIIKQLSRLYISFAVDKNKYSDLVSYMEALIGTPDADIIREVEMVRQRIQDELVRLLQK